MTTPTSPEITREDAPASGGTTTGEIEGVSAITVGTGVILTASITVGLGLFVGEALTPTLGLGVLVGVIVGVGDLLGVGLLTGETDGSVN